MPRGLPAAVLTEIAKESVVMIHLIKMEFDSGDQLYTDSHTDITFSGDTYLAESNFISFGNVTETLTMDLGSNAFILSSVNQGNLAIALTENYTDRKITLYRGFLNSSTYALLVDPVIIYEGRVTSFAVREDPQGGTSTLSWNTASLWADYQQTAGRRSNNKDQQVYYPADTGLEYADQIFKDLKWGRT